LGCAAQLKALPVPNPNEKREIHDQIVKLVDEIMRLKLLSSTIQTPQEKHSLERQVAATDQQIDQLVYELYDLTEEEIKIVEESVS
jgi:hypothetical protein